MKRIKVRVTFIEECLGTSSADPNLHAEYIASKAPDALSREEEIEAVGAEEYFEKGMTVFPMDENGVPFFWDYQFRGFFKDSCSALQRTKGEDFSKESCALKAFKKVIDGCIFVEPRRIPIHLSGEMGICQRPLRAATAQGERIALSSSATVPAGSTVEFTVVCLSDKYEAVVLEWLEYGRWRGMGAWRNSSKGSFWYELLDEQGNVIGGNKPANDSERTA